MRYSDESLYRPGKALARPDRDPNALLAFPPEVMAAREANAIAVLGPRAQAAEIRAARFAPYHPAKPTPAAKAPSRLVTNRRARFYAPKVDLLDEQGEPTTPHALAARADLLLKAHGFKASGTRRRKASHGATIVARTRAKVEASVTSKESRQADIAARWDAENAARLKARQDREATAAANARALPSWTGLR